MTQDCWSYSLRVRGPHFASKVSYNAGAATDDYAGQIKAEPVFIKKTLATPFLSPSPTAATRKLPAATAFRGAAAWGVFSEYGRQGRRGHTLSR